MRRFVRVVLALAALPLLGSALLLSVPLTVLGAAMVWVVEVLDGGRC